MTTKSFMSVEALSTVCRVSIFVIISVYAKSIFTTIKQIVTFF